MSSIRHEQILLTPGPLTTSLRTREAMLKDWGSRDSGFIRFTKEICENLIAIIHGEENYVCVPLQGSGTFAVEATLGTLLSKNGKALILVNGAYGKRIVTICKILGLPYVEFTKPESVPILASDVQAQLDKDATITDVVVVHCETSVGVLNPLEEISKVVQSKGCKFIIDAMSSFGAIDIDSRKTPFDALVAASGKCLEGGPGMGFALVKKATLLAAKGNSPSLVLDLVDQYIYLQKTGQWRFTPPTHVVAALHEAIMQFNEEGGIAGRSKRYKENCTLFLNAMKEMGFRSFVDEAVQAPVIMTFHAPIDKNYDFEVFYGKVRAKGFVLYPGKLTEQETFRVGCIGDVLPDDMLRAASAIKESLKEMNVVEIS